MLNNNILSTEIQNFINSNLNADPYNLLLKSNSFVDVSIKEVVNQIIAKKKSQIKLPTWFKTDLIYYPSKISIEQTSSEPTAAYKASLISGNSLIDITGGFGVDAYFFSKSFQKVIHCEINKELSSIVSHNYKILNVTNIETINTDGLAYLKESENTFSTLYVDPSRRDQQKGKVFFMEDCIPNIPDNLELLLEKANSIMIKYSPMLDISYAIEKLSFLKEIHIVGVKNEVKELLFLIDKNYRGKLKIHTINISNNGNQQFSFNPVVKNKSHYSPVKQYIYEPNACILKSGAFDQITYQFNVTKLHKHSHIYTSDELIDFPGRRFMVSEVIHYDKKRLKKITPNQKANITVRNFPKSVAQIRKETKLKDGGDTYLFFTKNNTERQIVIICSPIFK